MAARWYWKDGDCWCEYDQAECATIEAAFKTPSRDVLILSGRYKVDLESMVQANARTGMKRKVLREGSEQPEVWEWQENDGRYVAFEDHQASQLSVARQAGRPHTVLHPFQKGASYRVTFGDPITQQNLHTDKVRAVRVSQSDLASSKSTCKRHPPPATSSRGPSGGGGAGVPFSIRFDAKPPSSLDLATVTRWTVLSKGARIE